MLIKTLELIIIIIMISFIFLQVLQISDMIYNSYIINYQFLERFLRGRFLIKFLTESDIFSNGICNLNQNFTYFLDGKINLYDLIKEKELIFPSKIEIIDLNSGEKILEFGNYTGNYVSFSRVCYHNGKLIKIQVLV